MKHNNDNDLIEVNVDDENDEDIDEDDHSDVNDENRHSNDNEGISNIGNGDNDEREGRVHHVVNNRVSCRVCLGDMEENDTRWA